MLNLNLFIWPRGTGKTTNAEEMYNELVNDGHNPIVICRSESVKKHYYGTVPDDKKFTTINKNLVGENYDCVIIDDINDIGTIHMSCFKGVEEIYLYTSFIGDVTHFLDKIKYYYKAEII